MLTICYTPRHDYFFYLSILILPFQRPLCLLSPIWKVKKFSKPLLLDIATMLVKKEYLTMNLSLSKVLLRFTVWQILSLCLGPKVRSSASIIVRGANYFMCDEIERSTHDALCVVKRVFESKSLVCGGGSVEAALSIFLENYADR